MAKEYIEREALLKDIQAYKDKGGLGSCVAGTLERYVKRVSTADVAEVKRGEWIYHECVSSYEGAISGYSCSECCAFVDEEIFEADEIHKNFCGCCGAKMDGKKVE